MRTLVIATTLMVLAFAGATALRMQTTEAHRVFLARRQAQRLTEPQWGTTYRLVYDLGMALKTNNYTWAASLIDDNALIAITAAHCGVMTKTQFLELAKSEPILARYFDFGPWVGVDAGSALIRAQTGVVMGPSSVTPNQTWIIDDAMFYGMPNEAGDQLMIFEQTTSRNDRQANTSAMLAAFDSVVAATTLKDIQGWRDNLADGFEFYMHAAFGQYPTYHGNRSVFLESQAENYARAHEIRIHTNFKYASCDFVLGSIVYSVVYKDGTADIQQFAVSMQLDADFKIIHLSEFAMMPWTKA